MKRFSVVVVAAEILPYNWLRVFRRANTAHLGHRGGPEQELSVVPSEKYAACRRSVEDRMRMITACFARALQRWTSRICVHFLLTFQEVMPISKTRNQLVLMMEATRSLGLAARFVSGYIFVPNVDAGSAVGGGATHAWMQVYLPGAGWVDFDPTNSTIGNRNLIRVAVAWDPRLVLPLWGTFIGSASSVLGMDVTVTVTEEDRAAAGADFCP
jgi:hypothetical protein